MLFLSHISLLLFFPSRNMGYLKEFLRIFHVPATFCSNFWQHGVQLFEPILFFHQIFSRVSISLRYWPPYLSIFIEILAAWRSIFEPTLFFIKFLAGFQYLPDIDLPTHQFSMKFWQHGVQFFEPTIYFLLIMTNISPYSHSLLVYITFSLLETRLL